MGSYVEPDAAVRLCCGKPHDGPICPDGTVPCCVCSVSVPVELLWTDGDGQQWDMCPPCGKEEATMIDDDYLAPRARDLTMQINTAEGPRITIDLTHGTVELADGMIADDAAALFWEKVRELGAPDIQMVALAEEISCLKADLAEVNFKFDHADDNAHKLLIENTQLKDEVVRLTAELDAWHNIDPTSPPPEMVQAVEVANENARLKAEVERLSDALRFVGEMAEGAGRDVDE